MINNLVIVLASIALTLSIVLLAIAVDTYVDARKFNRKSRRPTVEGLVAVAGIVISASVLVAMVFV